MANWKKGAEYGTAGAAAGSYFGPYGAAIGGVGGGLYGLFGDDLFGTGGDTAAAKQAVFDANAGSLAGLSNDMDARRKAALQSAWGQFGPVDNVVSKMYGPGAMGPGIDIDALFGGGALVAGGPGGGPGGEGGGAGVHNEDTFGGGDYDGFLNRIAGGPAGKWTGGYGDTATAATASPFRRGETGGGFVRGDAVRRYTPEGSPPPPGVWRPPVQPRNGPIQPMPPPPPPPPRRRGPA